MTKRAYNVAVGCSKLLTSTAKKIKFGHKALKQASTQPRWRKN
jgi:hypothetical protein